MNKKILMSVAVSLLFLFMVAAAFVVFWYIIPVLICMMWNNVLIDAISGLNEISINAGRAILTTFVLVKAVGKSIQNIV